MPRGGRRTGSPGSSYTNRTDLAQNRGPLPVQTAPSAQYGQAAALQRAQKVVPIAPPPSPGLSPATPAGQGSPAGAGGATPPALPAPDYTGPQPGSFGPFLRPTEQPGTPVTAGLPFGPGPGPEALTSMNQPTPSPLLAGLATLNALGDQASPLVSAVRAAANALQASGQP